VIVRKDSKVKCARKLFVTRPALVVLATWSLTRRIIELNPASVSKASWESCATRAWTKSEWKAIKLVWGRIVTVWTVGRERNVTCVSPLYSVQEMGNSLVRSVSVIKTGRETNVIVISNVTTMPFVRIINVIAD